MTSFAHAVTTAAPASWSLLLLPIVLRRLLPEGDGAQGEDETECQAG